jgi:hypothetical protein
MIPPLLAFAIWIPVSILLFRRYPIRIAILANFLGGWAVLPSAHYVGVQADFAYWIVGVSLPSNYFITKASVLSFTALLNVMLMDKQVFRRFQLTFWDLPMTLWCAVPLLSALANIEQFKQGMVGEIYQLLAWGVPYVLGRLYFSDTASLRLAAKAFILAGMLYVPICLVEILIGPQFYAHVYGYEPFRWTGAPRYFGYRPVGFLETGNQLGIWMATSALIAAWLGSRRTAARILGIPCAWIAIVLFLVTLLCQSIGSIILLLGLLPFVFISMRFLPRVVTVLVICAILLFAGLRLENEFSVRRLVENNYAAHSVSTFLNKIGRGSFTWKLAVDERYVDKALDKPILGSGDWKWWAGGDVRPWGMWMLTFGMYGLVGLVALESVLLIPVVRVVWFTVARSDIEDFNLRHALAAAILMSAVDGLLNSSMLLPLVLVIGGMSTWESAVSSLHIEVETHPARNLRDLKKADVTFKTSGLR